MYSIDCIVPYPNLLEVVTEVWAEHPYRDRIQFLPHPKAVYEIPGYPLHGDIAIARGMSVQFLRSNYPNMPVVEIPMSVYDILMAFNGAEKHNPHHVALVGLPNVIYVAEELGRKLFKSFSVYPVDKNMDYERVVAQAIRDGVDFVVGGNAVFDYARNMGVGCALITTSKGSVRQAIDEAISILEFSTSQRAFSKSIQALLNNISEGIVSIDSRKIITVFNADAERFFGMREEIVIGKELSEVLPILDKPDISTMVGATYGNVIRIDDKAYAINKFPIRVDGNFSGAVMIIQPANVIRDMETKIRQATHFKGFVAKYGFDDILGKSEALVQAKKLAIKYSKVNSSILIVGETGTGKELFAQSIHNASDRRSEPFIAINCAALPENLLESELFGYAAGAFTGAAKGGKTGLFELAHKGTIFLDEVSEMSLSLQGRLLRVLAEHSIIRLGDDTVVPIDVRIISATNRNIEDEVKAGRFRRDLFFRLNVLRLDIPPLRSRGSDVISLAKFFLELYDNKLGVSGHWFSADCYPYLMSYGFLGNVRELGNMCERLSVVLEPGEITPDDLEALFGKPATDYTEEIPDKKKVEQALKIFKSKASAARFLNVNRSTLYRKIEKYGIRIEESDKPDGF